MPEKYGEMNIENCVLTSSNGEIFAWQGIKDVTTEMEDEVIKEGEPKISVANNLECCFSFRLSPRYKKRFERFQYGWVARGPIRKRLWYKMFRRYKFYWHLVKDS